MDVHMHHGYSPPFALTVLSGSLIGIGALCFLVITADIVWRRGWQSMMWIMIPVYPINAAYMLPLELYVYFKYGRAAHPSLAQGATLCYSQASPTSKVPENRSESDDIRTSGPAHPTSSCCHAGDQGEQHRPDSGAEKGHSLVHSLEPAVAHSQSHCHNDASRPMWATVLVSVSHCGAGCVLGDIVGEWLVHGTGITINGAELWPALLVDYAFALLFGIAFQYFSIAPMSGEYGPKTIWRAAKADVVSLTSFEVGAFGWMIIYQAGIFDYKLSMLSWTYWWMMQIGMAFGFATAIPVNWWLITKGIKEPCA